MLRRIFNYISTSSNRELLKSSLYKKLPCKSINKLRWDFFEEKRLVGLNPWWWKNDFIHSIHIQRKFTAYRRCVKYSNEYFPLGKNFYFCLFIACFIVCQAPAKYLTDTAFNLHTTTLWSGLLLTPSNDKDLWLREVKSFAQGWPVFNTHICSIPKPLAHTVFSAAHKWPTSQAFWPGNLDPHFGQTHNKKKEARHFMAFWIS